MRGRKPSVFFAPREVQQFLLPITVTASLVMAGLIVQALLDAPSLNIGALVYSVTVIAGTVVNHLLIVRTGDFRESYGWLNAFVSGVGLGLLPYFFPPRVVEITHLLIPLGTIAVAIVSGRPYGYLTLGTILILDLLHVFGVARRPLDFLDFSIPYLVAAITVEAVLQIKHATQQHIHRLEIINKLSRQMMLSLETEQTLSLLNATFQEALAADTYFVGILKENEIELNLLYDEGEYYQNVRLPLDGTLSGWVIKNQKELFLPDLRQRMELEGVEKFIIGKQKNSLSWMGVPLTSPHIRGVISLGSYQPNAFDSADMELLSNLAQHITLALDNAIRHAQVEEQARLDSLTGVYNHGYFLKKLGEQTAEVSNASSTLSLIMLDIDFFKQYNDTYGHLVGDRILTLLTATIRQHIKQTDAVGRWGGEEFVISLPGAGGEKALEVAERINQTMAAMKIEDREQQTIPVPTVSQGIAVFPGEADEIYRLIDLADRRLYLAKERGRNQIEPGLDHWRNG